MKTQDFEVLVKQLPPHEQADARELSNNIIFMRRKLKEARLDLQDQGLTAEYDNGGGQTGIRKNPGFEAYNSLVKTYQSTVLCLRQLLGLDQPKTSEEQPQSELAKMRSKFGGKYKLVTGGP